jgi:hypothetical protein
MCFIICRQRSAVSETKIQSFRWSRPSDRSTWGQRAAGAMQMSVDENHTKHRYQNVTVQHP